MFGPKIKQNSEKIENVSEVLLMILNSHFLSVSNC